MTVARSSGHRATMTGRQRVNAMLDRRDHDRVPRHETFWPETIDLWRTQGLTGDQQHVLDLLGSDFAQICWTKAHCYPGRREVIEEDDQTQVIRDGQGKTVRIWKHRSGTPEHIAFGCQSRDDWNRIYKLALLSAPLQIDPADAARCYAAGRRQGRWCHLVAGEVFEMTRALIGDEAVAIAMAEDPDWIVDMAETITAQLIRNLEAAMDTGIAPDGLWVYGDMAYNHATFCSPAMYKELIWPLHKRLADWAHQHGMKFIYHTDGNVNGVLDLYVEAGFDCYQPIEAKAGMDIRQLVPQYGDRLAFFGNVDVMVMATNDREKIEAEVRSKIEAGKAKRCYAYHSDHSVPPSVSWPTYQFIIDLVDKYGWYD